jgi:hypothetical protein
VHLDVSNTLCLDSHIFSALCQLKHLATLKANGCRKLTASVGTVVFGHPSASLQHVCLQRCFQLTASALWHALDSTKHPGSRLATLTLSHIDVRECTKYLSATAAMRPPVPADVAESECSSCASPAAAPPHAASARSSLCTLALHCCEGLSPAFFAALAHEAPALRTLLLGGSSVCPHVAAHLRRLGGCWQRSNAAPALYAQRGGARWSRAAAPPGRGCGAAAGVAALAADMQPLAVADVFDFVCRIREETVHSTAPPNDTSTRCAHSRYGVHTAALVP